MSFDLSGSKAKKTKSKSGVKLPKQEDHLRDWSEANIFEIFQDNSEIYGNQFLNKIVDAFFPAKELFAICNKRHISYDQEGKRIGAEGDPRLSIYVGNTFAMSKALYDGDKDKFEEQLIEFFSSLFLTQEKEVVQKCLKSEMMIQIVIINSFWANVDSKRVIEKEIIAAATFVVNEETLVLLYIGVKHDYIVWPYYSKESKEQAVN